MDPFCYTITAHDGVPLVADLWNPAANATLLLLPCGGEVRTVWRRVVECLPEQVQAAWRIVAADHRGHGDSGRSAIYRFAQFLDDVFLWIEKLHTHPLVIAGGSLGGALGLVATGEGAAVDGVVLLDVPTVPVQEQALAEGRRVAAARERNPTAVATIDPEFLASGFIADVFRDADRWRRAAIQLRVPTLLIGSARGVIGPHRPPLYHEHVPHGDFEALDTGHLVAREAPRDVARLLGAFLSQFESFDPSESRERPTLHDG